MDSEESSLRAKLSQTASSVSDRVAILDARDKLFRLYRIRQTDLATAVAVIGTCPDMCPEIERYRRHDTNQVVPLECHEGSVDYDALVKEYRRSGADQEEPLPHELRPANVLNRTMDYLCTNVLDYCLNVEEWYDFLWSRMRAIRKDITQQHLCDLNAVSLTEKCARFHIHCAMNMCEQDLIIFDPKINDENLMNCLQSLKNFYFDLSLRDISCPCEPEFRAYEILLHLHDVGILRDVKNFNEVVRESPQVKLAIEVFYAFHSNNYVKFFRLLRQADYLTSCLMHRYFNEVRGKTMKILKRSYTSNSHHIESFPMELLDYQLCFDDRQQLITFCEKIGVKFDENSITLKRGTTDLTSLTKTKSKLVENKRNNLEIGAIINGGQLPINPYKAFPLYDSFDEHGRLKKQAIDMIGEKRKNNKEILQKQQQPSNADKPQQVQPLQQQERPETSRNFFSFIAKEKSLSRPETPPFGQQDQTQQAQSQLFQLKAQSNEPTRISFQMPPIQGNTISFMTQPIQSQPVFGDTIAKRDNLVERISESVLNDWIDDLIREVMKDACVGPLSMTLLIQFFNQVIPELVYDAACDAYADIKVDNQAQEKAKLVQKLLELTSQQLINEMIEEVVEKDIESTARRVLFEEKQKLIEELSHTLNESILNEVMTRMIGRITEQVMSEELYNRNEKVHLIQSKKALRLAKKYFTIWRNVCSKRRRFEHTRKTFPAGPVYHPPEKINFKDLSYFESEAKTEKAMKHIDKALTSSKIMLYVSSAPINIIKVVEDALCASTDAVRPDWKLALVAMKDHSKIICDKFFPKENQNELLGIKTRKVGSLHVNICLKAFLCDEQVLNQIKLEDTFGMHGLMALSNRLNLKNTLQAVVHIIKNKPPQPAIPILLIIEATNCDEASIQNQVDSIMSELFQMDNQWSGLCGEITISLIPNFFSGEWISNLERSLIWLAKSRPNMPDKKLSRRYLRDLIDETISYNFDLLRSIQCQIPSHLLPTLCKCFNSLLDCLTQDITTHDLSLISWPAPELNQDIDFEWNSRDRFAQIRSKIDSLRLPESDSDLSDYDVDTIVWSLVNAITKYDDPKLESDNQLFHSRVTLILRSRDASNKCIEAMRVCISYLIDRNFARDSNFSVVRFFHRPMFPKLAECWKVIMALQMRDNGKSKRKLFDDDIGEETYLNSPQSKRNKSCLDLSQAKSPKKLHELKKKLAEEKENSDALKQRLTDALNMPVSFSSSSLIISPFRVPSTLNKISASTSASSPSNLNYSQELAIEIEDNSEDDDSSVGNIDYHESTKEKMHRLKRLISEEKGANESFNSSLSVLFSSFSSIDDKQEEADILT